MALSATGDEATKGWLRLALMPEHMDRGSCMTAQPVSGRSASSVRRSTYSGYSDVHAAALFSGCFYLAILLIIITRKV